MLSKKELWELRQQIRLGSIYLADYKNTFGIDKDACFSFFDSFCEEIGFLAEEAGLDDNDPNYWEKAFEQFDNSEELYYYYESMDTDPLPITCEPGRKVTFKFDNGEYSEIVDEDFIIK